MAQINFSPNTFAGTLDVNDIFKKLYVGNDIFRRQLMDIRTGVKSKTILRTLDVNPVFSTPSATFSSTTAVPDADERYLDPLTYEVRLELDASNFTDTWETQFLAPGTLADYEGESRLLLAMTDLILERSAHLNGALYMMGKSYNPTNLPFSGTYNGLIPSMVADSSVNTVLLTNTPAFSQAITGITVGTTTVVAHASNTNIKVGDIVTFSTNVGGTTQIRGLSGRVLAATGTATTVAIDSTGFGAWTSGGVINFINKSNVKDALDAVWSATPLAVQMNPNVRIYLPHHIYEAYKRAEADTASTNIKYSNGGDANDYFGYKIEKMVDFQSNCILVTNWDNLVLGIDIEADQNNLNVTYSGAITNDMVHRFRLSMKSCVNYIFPSQITIIKPANV